ncbi:hypothetical protein VitviT2T_018069 [Vitis vinifera]|uniref:Myb/SANT-like domain-containing protein n=1 Tax=Vitis vinifera TaxID=29760 RepID=A0ABY9CWY6_VITVI|nr:hypothetical protein VitviT2T_018069 [Vitis vinifera]
MPNPSPPIPCNSLQRAILYPHLIPKVVISSFSSSIALHPRLHSWKDAPLSFDIVDLIEGFLSSRVVGPKIIFGFLGSDREPVLVAMDLNWHLDVMLKSEGFLDVEFSEVTSQNVEISKVNWTDPIQRKHFIDLCLQEANKGFRSGGGLKSSAWPRIAEELEKLLGRHYTSKQLKNGWIT